MRSVTNAVALLVSLTAFAQAGLGDLRDDALRKAILKAGFVTPDTLFVEEPKERIEAGRLLFESNVLSLNENISCQTCHLDKFGSADGIPNAIGVGGVGEGTARMKSGGEILPRNAMPFWGRGQKGYEVFFWDGRVDASGSSILSQFGIEAPSADPLTVAAHLPPVEIREMLVDDEHVQALFRHEDVDAAKMAYAEIAKQIQSDEKISTQLSLAYDLPKDKIEFINAAESLAAFIRTKFAIKETKLHRFVFSNGELSKEELAGGIIFYGKGRCVACHSGAYFTDFSFHAIPFPEAGFGKNGFGVDYGRYNVTYNPDDMYKFRTPPLFNVEKTAPYSHSGSLYQLTDVVRAHFDPLAVLDTKTMTPIERNEFYERLRVWSGEKVIPTALSDEEIADLVAFLKTLSF